MINIYLHIGAISDYPPQHRTGAWYAVHTTNKRPTPVGRTDLFFANSGTITIQADLEPKESDSNIAKQEARSKKQEARSKKQEARSKKQEARSKYRLNNEKVHRIHADGAASRSSNHRNSFFSRDPII
jgi:hypothetical protein